MAIVGRFPRATEDRTQILRRSGRPRQADCRSAVFTTQTQDRGGVCRDSQERSDSILARRRSGHSHLPFQCSNLRAGDNRAGHGEVQRRRPDASSRIIGITFALYKDQQGGAPLWLENQSLTLDAAGHYTVQLGAILPSGLPKELFASGEARWLGVQPEGQPEQPRVLLLSVPYALKAADAETIGGLPPSAFVLATPAVSSNGTAANAATSGNTASLAPPPGTVSGTGTANFIPLWTDGADIANSIVFQSGTGSTAKIGVNTTTPTTTLDVKGTGTIRGLFTLPSVGVATAAKGSNSQPISMTASAFNSGTAAAVNQNFRWQAEPAANNTATPSGTLNLLFGSGTTAPAETGLKISNNGVLTFATGQTFPGTGTGTITSVTAGPGLTGGGTGGNVTVALTGSCGLGQFLQWNSVTWICTNVITSVTPGTDLTGSVTNGIATLSLDTTQVPQLNISNTFTGNQTVSGNLSATGAVTGSAFQIGSNLFGFGSYANANAFLGFGGNTQTTGASNTAVGALALLENGSGFQNTSVGASSLLVNSTGSNNTASGTSALQANTGGSYNTASGVDALSNNTTGNYNSALGFLAGPDSAHPTLANSTAIGALASVTASNSIVLGSIAGVNGATSNTNVGIGTTAPAATLDVHGTGNFTAPVTFAASQTFPNTISGVTAGSGLTGGGTTGNVTLNLDTTAVPLLNAANQFTGNQSVAGNVRSINLTAVDAVAGQTGFFTGGTGPYTLEVNQPSPGIAVFGDSTGASGTGVFGMSSDSNGVGVEGLNNSATGGVGVFGVVNSTSGTGIGVWGKTGSGTGSSIGVEGDASSPTGLGLFASNAGGGLAALFQGGVQVNGNFAGTGTITGATINATSAFSLGGVLFDSGSTSLSNAFLGFAGNSTTTGLRNVASGSSSLVSNTTGNDNTASGVAALNFNTMGAQNTAVGEGALSANSTGSTNTAIGYDSGRYAVNKNQTTGSSNTFVGAFAGTGSSQGTNLTNATAIGANAEVDESNALVLGSISGVNLASASTNVGIGTTAPTVQLQVQGNDNTGTGVQTLTNNVSTSGNSFAVVATTSSAGVTNEMVADGLGTGPLHTPSGYFGTYTNQPIGFITGNVERMLINTSGLVGIGTSAPTHIFQVAQGLGNAFADGWSTYSSRRWKTNIQTLPNALAKVEQLRGVSYDLKGTGKHEIGVIAEEVGEVVPEVVSFEANGKDAQGVDYSRLTAVLIEAVKQQQKQILAQQRQIRAQQKQIARLAGKVGVLETALHSTERSAHLTSPTQDASPATGNKFLAAK